MSSVPEIQMVRVLDLEQSTARDEPTTEERPAWGARTSRKPPRLSAPALVVLALVAGAGAMALGAVAVVQASARDDRPAGSALPEERDLRQALHLLAKPSTARVPFQGSAGTLVLAVGSGGRAALVLRSFAVAPSGKAHHAWIAIEGGRPRHAATFTGSQQVVPLSGLVVPGSSVLVTTGPAESPVPPSGSVRLVARL